MEKKGIIFKENPAITIISYTPVAAHFANGTFLEKVFLGPPFHLDVHGSGRQWIS